MCGRGWGVCPRWPRLISAALRPAAARPGAVRPARLSSVPAGLRSDLRRRVQVCGPAPSPIGCGYQSGRRCVCSMCRCCVSCVCGGVYVDSFTWACIGRVTGCYCLHFLLSANNSFRTMSPFSPCASGCLRWVCPGLRRGASLPGLLAAASASVCAVAALAALYAVVRLLGVIVPAPSVCARPGGFLWLSVNLCAASGPRYARECLRLSLRR